MRRLGTIALSIGLLIILGVFAQGITDSHLSFDDWGYTGGCPFVRDGVTWQNLRAAFLNLSYGAIWMPVTFFSYMLDVSIFGNSWPAHHAVNVALHLINAILVYSLLRRLLSVEAVAKPVDAIVSIASIWRKPSLSDAFETNASTCKWDDAAYKSFACALAALLWAIHPLRAEAVVCISARKEELWVLFSLLGMLAYDSFLSGRSLWHYALTFFCFLLSLMSKPTAMCFPFLLLAVAYLKRELNRRALLFLLPMVLLSVGAGLLTIYSQSHPSGGVASDVYHASFGWRLLNAMVSIGLYNWYAICPWGIHSDYRAVFGGWPVNGLLGLASLALLLLATIFASLRLSSRGRRVLFTAWALFIFSVGPTLGVFGYVNGDQAMADRYSYFPQIAISLLVAYFLASARPGVWSVRAGDWRKNLIVRENLIVGAAILFVAELAIAEPIVKSYENSYTAGLRTLYHDPNNWRALRIVGNEYCARQNRMDEGIKMLRRSLFLRKSHITASSLAYILALRGGEGDYAEVKRLGAGVASSPARDEGGMMLDALGIVSMHEGDYARAASFFSASLRATHRNHSPDWSELNLALCLIQLGKRDEAKNILTKLEKSRIPQVAAQAKVEISKGMFL